MPLDNHILSKLGKLLSQENPKSASARAISFCKSFLGRFKSVPNAARLFNTHERGAKMRFSKLRKPGFPLDTAGFPLDTGCWLDPHNATKGGGRFTAPVTGGEEPFVGEARQVD